MEVCNNNELSFPAGFRFHPTEEELVMHYLLPKCASKSIPTQVITEVDLYKFDPWQLPALACYGEKEWYFFSPRDRKYPNGSRPNRAAGNGYWKATGVDKPVGRPNTLAIKKALVFYAGKPPRGTKTNWIMHEYRLNVDRSASRSKKNLRLDDWVLCRIYNKKGVVERHYDDHDTVDTPDVSELEDEKPTIYALPSTDSSDVTSSGTYEEVVKGNANFTWSDFDQDLDLISNYTEAFSSGDQFTGFELQMDQIPPFDKDFYYALNHL